MNRIIFMGTPDFAVASLRSLLEAGHNVVAVVTTPDRYVGKHQSSPQACAVKIFAEAHNIPVLQPEKLRDEEFLSRLRSYNADLQVVVAFRMLPEAVWNMPRLGTINLHASLLPQYRGAAPINWAIINGEKETGVTTFFLNSEIDAGNIIMQRRVPIGEDEDAGALHDELMEVGAKATVETVELILSGQASSVSQEMIIKAENELNKAPKIFTETCRIDWKAGLDRVGDFIRGLSPYPGAWTEIVSTDGERFVLKIFKAKKIVDRHKYVPGMIIRDCPPHFLVAVDGGMIELQSVQIAGKRRMSASEFLNGFHKPEIRVE